MKILIWNTYELQKTGGPSGYLYGLKLFVEQNSIKSISFLDYYQKTKAELSGIKKLASFFRSTIKRIVPKKIQNFISIYLLSSYHTKQKTVLIDDLNQYDFIHFHTTLELYIYKNYIKDNFKGSIILTSHSPKPYHKEIVEDVFGFSIDDIPKSWFNKIEAIDKVAFDTADFILFPCKEAIEPYSKNWTYFEKIEKSKFLYVPTGTFKATITNSREQIRKKYSIPENSFVISYIGRHNLVKGYDLLKDFATRILSKYQDVFFLIAGNEYPLQGLRHPRWIEVGWTNQAHDLINASDLFILPNRETYFDLVLLEVLSLAKPVMLSYTGGNKFFDRFTEKDFYFFDSANIDSMILAYEKAYSLKDSIHGTSKKNLSIFMENFTLDIFGNSYISTLEAILNENEQGLK